MWYFIQATAIPRQVWAKAVNFSMEDEEIPIYTPSIDEETSSLMESYNTKVFYSLLEDVISDQSDVEGLQIEANACGKGTRKRARVDNMLNPDTVNTPITDMGRPVKPMKSNTVRKKRHIEQIIRLVGQGMPDIRKIWQSQNVVLPALHLFQLSPIFWSETSRLLHIQRKTRKKKGAKPTASTDPTGSMNSGLSAGDPIVSTNSVQVQDASTYHTESESLAAIKESL